MKHPLGERDWEKPSAVDRKLAVDEWGRMSLGTVEGVKGWYEERWRREGYVDGGGDGVLGGRDGGDGRGDALLMGLQDGVGNVDLRIQETRGRGQEGQVHSQEPNTGSLTEVSDSGHTGGRSTSEVELVKINGMGLSRKFQDDFLW